MAGSLLPKPGGREGPHLRLHQGAGGGCQAAPLSPESDGASDADGCVGPFPVLGSPGAVDRCGTRPLTQSLVASAPSSVAPLARIRIGAFSAPRAEGGLPGRSPQGADDTGTDHAHRAAVCPARRIAPNYHRSLQAVVCTMRVSY